MTGPVNLPNRNLSIRSVIWNHFSQARNPSPGESRILHLVYGILEIFPLFGQIGAVCERSYRMRHINSAKVHNTVESTVATVSAAKGIQPTREVELTRVQPRVPRPDGERSVTESDSAGVYPRGFLDHIRGEVVSLEDDEEDDLEDSSATQAVRFADLQMALMRRIAVFQDLPLDSREFETLEGLGVIEADGSNLARSIQFNEALQALLDLLPTHFETNSMPDHFVSDLLQFIEENGSACRLASDFEFNQSIVPAILKALMIIERTYDQVIQSIPQNDPSKKVFTSKAEKDSQKCIWPILSFIRTLPLGRKNLFINSLILNAKSLIQRSDLDRANQLITYAEQLAESVPDSPWQIAEAQRRRSARNERIRSDTREGRLPERSIGFASEATVFEESDEITPKVLLDPRRRYPAVGSRLIRGIEYTTAPVELPLPLEGKQPVFGSVGGEDSPIDPDILALSSEKQIKRTCEGYRNNLPGLLELIQRAANAADVGTSKENQERLYPNLLKFIIFYNNRVDSKATIPLIQSIKRVLRKDQLILLSKEFSKRSIEIHRTHPIESSFLNHCSEILVS